MKIRFKDKHYSVVQNVDFELPKFTVLTGKNGSGKTHLLEAISKNEKSDVFIDGKKIKNIKYIPFNGLNPVFTKEANIRQIDDFITNCYNSLKKALRQSNSPDRTINEASILLLVNNDKQKVFLKRVIDITGKNIPEITRDDFKNNFKLSDLYNNNFFNVQLALIFKGYYNSWFENEQNKFFVQSGNKPISPVLSEEEFVKEFGQEPWHFMNKLFTDLDIPYETNIPEGRPDNPYVFKLIDKNEKFEITADTLSTGEKVLMSLAIAIYNCNDDSGKPELLLIDEPDAALHPSMTKKMITILKDAIVKISNIPVIITTHSPITVMAVDGLSIYKLERGDNVPIKISIQDAVELLSGDIPFLKISNESRRQVFVESKYDVEYYEQLTNIYRKKENLPSEPTYIPARTSSGSNCTDVIDVVNNLCKNGNDQVYGIIDWDLNNNSEGRIIVLGNGKRYAIENFILDPLLMGIFMIRDNKIEISEFGELSASNYMELKDLNSSEAQSIINYILKILELNSDNLIKYNTYNGWELDISTEFCRHQGHELEALYKKKFGFLNAHHNEGALKKEVINKVINDFPEYAPKSIMDTLKKIQ